MSTAVNCRQRVPLRLWCLVMVALARSTFAEEAMSMKVVKDATSGTTISGFVDTSFHYQISPAPAGTWTSDMVNAPNIVPEPSVGMLLGLALLGFGARRVYVLRRV